MRLDFESLELRTREPFHIARPSDPHGRRNVRVRLTGSDGEVGLGEAAPNAFYGETAETVAAVLPRLQGAFAIAFLFRDHPDLVVGARMGAPLTVGYGDGENYLGSDALAVAPWTQRIAYLDEGDWAVVRRDRIAIFDRANRPVTREIVESGASSAPVEKGNYRHYMLKEIHEQPLVVAVNLHYTKLATALSDGDEVAFIPPVSGG